MNTIEIFVEAAKPGKHLCCKELRTVESLDNLCENTNIIEEIIKELKTKVDWEGALLTRIKITAVILNRFPANIYIK